MKRVILAIVALAFILWPLYFWHSDPLGEPLIFKLPAGNTLKLYEPIPVPEPMNPAGGGWLGAGDSTSPFAAVGINFALLALLYYTMGKKPVAEALKNRRSAVAKEIEEANRMLRDAEAREKQYRSKLQNVEEELATARAALLEAGRGEKDRIIREAEEKAARLQKDTEFLIEQEIKQMRQDLWREAVESAVTAAEELLKRRITSSDQERLAEDYLEDLAGRQKRAHSVMPAKGGAE
jgi:F0F1-type ATP synthase membrane subunit b/b'